MDNDWKNSGHIGTLSEQESRARQLCFPHVFSWCTVQFPFLYLRHWIQLFMLIYHFHVVHIAVMCKNLFISIMNMDFLYSSIGKPKVYSPIPCFFPFMFHLTCTRKPAVFPQRIYLFWWSLNIFWFIHIDFFFTLSTESVGFVSFLSSMQHSHKHTVFKHYHEHDEQDAMIEKQKFVECFLFFFCFWGFYLETQQARCA